MHATLHAHQRTHHLLCLFISHFLSSVDRSTRHSFCSFVATTLNASHMLIRARNCVRHGASQINEPQDNHVPNIKPIYAVSLLEKKDAKTICSKQS
ncbi:hypothetical protein L209DRAFT_454030 [Thermothelomyces heterothallicus CBS 203.75]